MMRKFKHKTLGMIAEKNYDFSYGDYVIESIDANYSRRSKAYPDLRVVRTIPPELIENSQDREEVIEKDWIDDLIDDYINELITRGLPGVIEKELLRKAIQKNSPTKIKITDKQINTYYGKPIDPMYRAFLGCFLQDHNLLLKNEEYEIDFPTGGSGFVTCPSCKQEFEGSHPEHGYNMCEDCIG